MTLLQPTDVPSRMGINNAITSEIANHASLTDPASLHYDSGWVNIPLRAGFSASAETPQVRRVGKTVHLRGRIGGTVTAGGTVVVGDIPVGFRPSVLSMFAVSGSDANAAGRFWVNTIGELNFSLTITKTNGVSCASAYLLG
jgi:hypothetical protein